VRRFRRGDILIDADYDLGRWTYASGPSFPVAGTPYLPPPHDGAVFFRTDLGAHYVWDEPTATWIVIGGGGGAPTTAEYLVGALDGTLSAERVVTDTATVTWDLATPGQVKANATGVAAHAPTHQHGGADFLVAKILSPAALTGDVNDYAPGDGDFWRLDSDANRNVTGIGAGVSGQRLRITNIGAFVIRLKHQNAGSAAANRIIGAGAADVALASNEQAEGWYDATTLRWRMALV
jgi:hypothetical protein